LKRRTKVVITNLSIARGISALSSNLRSGKSCGKTLGHFCSTLRIQIILNCLEQQNLWKQLEKGFILEDSTLKGSEALHSFIYSYILFMAFKVGGDLVSFTGAGEKFEAGEDTVVDGL
jgi:hypothetical protein